MVKTGFHQGRDVHTTDTTKSSNHSGVSVFFLVWDLKTRWPLRVNTAKGSDLPSTWMSAFLGRSPIRLHTSSVDAADAMSIEQAHTQKTLIYNDFESTTIRTQ